MLPYVEIPLSHDQVALVSACDLPKIQARKWFAYRIAGSGQSGQVYLYGFKAGSKAGGKKVWMHNVIMDPPEGHEVDHINQNPLDNRRENLRVVSHQENCRNRGKRRTKSTSEWLGVCWSREKGRWKAAIRVDGRALHLGYFSDEREAAQAYNFATWSHFGPEAQFNEAPQPYLPA